MLMNNKIIMNIHNHKRNTKIPVLQMVHYYINKKQRRISTINIERQIIILCRVICQIQKALLP